MMTISVGQGSSARDFQVYSGLLSHHSALFKRLLISPQDQISYTLSHESVDIFQIFYDWLNSGELVGENDADLTVREIVEVYVFADFYLIQELKDRALDFYLLRFFKDWTAPQEMTSRIYEKTPEGASLWKLHVDIMVETFGFENLREWMHDDPKVFLADVMETCRDKKIALGSCPGVANGRGALWMAEKKARFCEKYHEHPILDSYPTFEPMHVNGNRFFCLNPLIRSQ
jgi:hypothetical protein